MVSDALAGDEGAETHQNDVTRINPPGVEVQQVFSMAVVFSHEYSVATGHPLRLGNE